MNAREAFLYVGVLVMFLAVSLAAVGLRGLPLALCAAAGGAMAFAAGMDTIRARRLAARHHLAVVVVGEALAGGAHVVSTDSLVAALDDEWLTNLAANVREEERQVWLGRVARGECSDR